jgi:hypothetical protein
MLLAMSRGIGIIAIVPFRVPVALLGYIEAIGFGWSTVWQTSGMISDIISGTVSADAEKYEVLAYLNANIERKLSRKYCSLEFWIAIFFFDFGRDTVRKARSGWHSSARSRQVLNILSPKSYPGRNDEDARD